MKGRYLQRIILAVAALAMMLAACGGGGGGGTGGGGASFQSPAANLAGTWAIASTITSNNCGDTNGVIDTFSGNITHDGTSNSFSMNCYQSSVLVASCNGTISGTSVSISSCSYSDGSGTTTSNVSGTLNAGNMTISGTDSWTYTEPGWGSCSGQSAWGAALSQTGSGGDVTKPTVPTGVTATASPSIQISLSWTASTDNVGVAGYKVYRGGVFLKQVNTTSTLDIGLSPSTPYCYTVSAVDTANNESAQSSQACATTPAGGGGGDTAPPSTPASMTGSVVSSSQINLSWAASTDNVGVTGYRLERCQGLACSNFSEIATRTTTSYSNISLTASTSYSYRVRAVDAAGNFSGYSNTFSATTPSAGPTTVTLSAAKDASIIWSDADASFANTNYGNAIDLGVGNYFLYGYYVSSYMKMGTLVDFIFDPATWSGRTITSAKLRLYVYDYAVQSTGRYVAYKIVDTMIGGNYQYPWSETGVTWNNAPSYMLSPTSTAYAPTNPTEYSEWDVTSMVQGWFTSGTMGNGIIILDMQAPPSIYYTTNQITTYYSRQYSTSAYRPKLIITY